MPVRNLNISAPHVLFEDNTRSLNFESENAIDFDLSFTLSFLPSSHPSNATSPIWSASSIDDGVCMIKDVAGEYEEGGVAGIIEAVDSGDDCDEAQEDVEDKTRGKLGFSVPDTLGVETGIDDESDKVDWDDDARRLAIFLSEFF
ncbi:uncharacterized protein L203_104631 [Cryptococcus depauperatus CBS 7841]|uniref:Uncharacterized protein n=1 Tax=Cryptococcus depauperatus CBS 7841 TaxID=1295531 RepID=A0A1E3ILY1_9TREE|nr:hypothetical protein L203_02165 [Cryptococcus depauperatus CBS 7841]